MPSYTSIINTLFRLMPGEKRTDALKSVFKLHPNSENFSDSTLANLQLDEHTRAWQTRHAVEACRGWKWPFWLNAQLNPSSPTSQAPPLAPLLSNTTARDAAAIPGLPATFAGTMDRRGMITPPGARFSIETWFRFGNEVIYPSEIFTEDFLTHSTTPREVTFSCETAHEHLTITATATEYADLRFIELTASATPKESVNPRPVTIYISIRPYNIDGVAPLHDLVYNSKGFWMSESQIIGWFTSRPSESWAGDARHGDAAFFMEHPPERTAVRCPAGMATAVSAFHFHTDINSPSKVQLVIPLEPAQPRQFPFAELAGRRKAADNTPEHNEPHPEEPAITIGNNKWGDLLNAASHQLSSLADIRSKEIHELFHHHNHWLVSATRALLYQGYPDQATRLLQYPALSIQKNGYLEAAGGKWGFQGQFLTALADYYRLTQAPASNAILTYRQIRIIGR